MTKGSSDVSAQSIVVYISQAGGEVEDLQDLIDGKETELDWVGSLNGQDVPIKVRIADDSEDDWPEETGHPTQPDRTMGDLYS